MTHDVDRDAAPAVAPAEPPAATAAPAVQAVGVSREAALARAVAGRVAVSSRAVGLMLARDTSTDLPIINPWTGQPEDMSQFRTADAPPPAAAADPVPTPSSSGYGAAFRAEIIKWLEKFAPA